MNKKFVVKICLPCFPSSVEHLFKCLWPKHLIYYLITIILLITWRNKFKKFCTIPNLRFVYTQQKELTLKMNTDERRETEACCQWEAHLRGPDMVREVLIGCLRPRQYLIKYHQTQVKAGYFISWQETHISHYHFKKYKSLFYFINLTFT